MQINLTKEQHALLNICFKHSYETLHQFHNNEAPVQDMDDDLIRFGDNWDTIKEKLKDLIITSNKVEK